MPSSWSRERDLYLLWDRNANGFGEQGWLDAANSDLFCFEAAYLGYSVKNDFAPFKSSTSNSL